MIAVNATKRYTLITIINYEKYQNQNGLSLTASMDKEKLRNTNGMKVEYKRNANRLQTIMRIKRIKIYIVQMPIFCGAYTPKKKGREM